MDESKLTVVNIINKPYQCIHCIFRCKYKHNLNKHTCMKRYLNNAIQLEIPIQLQLIDRLNKITGNIVKTNVHLPSGYVDILVETPNTSTYGWIVIEVKLWSDWHKAIGQVLSYLAYLNK